MWLASGVKEVYATWSTSLPQSLGNERWWGVQRFAAPLLTVAVSSAVLPCSRRLSTTITMLTIALNTLFMEGLNLIVRVSEH